MVKANLSRQNHTKKHTHTHSQKEKKEKIYIFWEVWGLLPAFSRCSVGVVPHVDVFLMYLWGGRWSPRLTPLPSWRSLTKFSNVLLMLPQSSFRMQVYTSAINIFFGVLLMNWSFITKRKQMAFRKGLYLPFELCFCFACLCRVCTKVARALISNCII